MTKAKKRYNGHPSRNLWNVALWFANDEGLYRMAQAAMRRCRTKDAAAKEIVEALRDAGATATPDGAPYSRTSVRYALRDL